MTDTAIGAQGGADSGQSAGGQPGTGDGAQGGTGAAGQQEQQGANSQQQSTERDSELESLRQRMRAADQRASAAEAKLKEINDKDLPEAEKLKRDHATLAQENEKLKADLRQARIDNAFLGDNTHTWHNPGAALRMLDLEAVEIDEQGRVTGLKEALARLAKDNPWMLKQQEGSDGGTNAGGKGSAAAPPMTGGTGNGQQTKTKLATRFGMLHTRQGG